MDIQFTLVCDGSSDRVLAPVVRWTLRQHLSAATAINGDWADLRHLWHTPRGLAERIERSLERDHRAPAQGAESAAGSHPHRRLHR